MDDVYINDPRQNSAKNRAQTLKKTKKKTSYCSIHGRFIHLSFNYILVFRD